MATILDHAPRRRGGRGAFMYLVGFPLLVIPFAVYNIIEFLIPGAAPGEFWSHIVTRIGLASGMQWALTAGEILLTLSLLLLFVEIIKSARVTSRSIIDHLLSTLLFIVMLIEFILVKQAASGTFFLLMIISFVDVVGGFSTSIRAAQRDIAFDRDTSQGP
jgi:hypothetical protein